MAQRSKDISPQPAPERTTATLDADSLDHMRGWGHRDNTAYVEKEPGYGYRFVAARKVRRNKRLGWVVDEKNAGEQLHVDHGGEEMVVMRIPQPRLDERAAVLEAANKRRAHAADKPSTGTAGFALGNHQTPGV